MAVGMGPDPCVACLMLRKVVVIQRVVEVYRWPIQV